MNEQSRSFVALCGAKDDSRLILGFFRTMRVSFMANHRTAPLHRMFTPFYCS